MRIREELNKNIPQSLRLVLVFLGLNLAFFLLFELVFSLIQIGLSQQDAQLSPDLILLAVLLSNICLVLLLLHFLNIYGEKISLTIIFMKRSVKTTLTVILVAIAFLLFVKYEFLSWWAHFFGQITIDIFPWPFHLFEPVKYDISYLIFYTLIFILIQPMWEELLFRRILIGNLLKQGFNKVYAVILSSFAFSLYLALYLLIEISINDLLWFFSTNLIGGIVLGALFVYTGRIRYPYLVSSITNVFLLLLFLSRNHFEFIPYRGFILFISQFTLLIGLLIIFYELLQEILDGKFIPTMKNLTNSILTFSWPSKSHLKHYWIGIVILIPIFPLGVDVFVDHTVLYTDLLALIIENGLSLIILVMCSILLYYNIRSDLLQEPDNKIKTMRLKINYNNTNIISKHNFSLRSILGGIRSRIVFIMLLLGAISPFYILSVVSLTKIEIVIVFQTLVDVSIFIAQNPFFTYQHVVTKIRSNIVFIGNSTEILDQFYLFQQSVDKWNFLPDTYMSTSADWIHGLMTVIFWFSLVVLYIYLLRKSRHYPLKAALGAVLLIIMNFIWILLAMGLGSIRAEDEVSGIPSLEDISLLVNFDIQIKEFLILPLGLLLLLIAATIILIQGFYKRKKRSPEVKNI